MKNDNRKLLNVLHSSSGELRSLHGFYLCFSLLSVSPESAETVYNEFFSELSEQGSYFQPFFLSNSDLIVFYSGIKSDVIQEALAKLSEKLTPFYEGQSNFLGQQNFASTLDLSADFVRLLRQIESIDRSWKRGSNVERPPVDVLEMSRIEGALSSVDFSNYLRWSAVYDVETEAVGSLSDAAVFTEVNIDANALFSQLSPDTDPEADYPLYLYFNNFLEKRFFSKMTVWASQMAGKKISTNMNLHLANSPDFEAALVALPADWRGNVIVELQIGDVVTNFDYYLRFVDIASKYDIMVCLDNLSPYWLLHFDLEVLGPEYAKVYFSEDTYNLDEVSHRAIRDKIKETDNCTIIMTGCESIDSLVHAGKYGVKYIQGTGIDSLLRKGLSLKDAFKETLKLETSYF